MSRSEEFNAGSGSRFHPNVDHYQSGGMGHLPDDPQRSVVGMVPTHSLVPYREYDRSIAKDHPGSRQVINSLRQDLRGGKGFHTPLMLEYNNSKGWAYLGEGNHRLQAALEEGVPEVPVRVVRSYAGPANRMADGIGAPARHKPIPGTEHDPSYVPSDLHPAHLELPGRQETHEARDVHTEIMDLLRPGSQR